MKNTKIGKDTWLSDTPVAIIGSGWGDEGKGAMTDFVAYFMTQERESSLMPVVARFNGGAQAGHTVTHQDGRSHVFHHIGAGSMAGAHTHLSRFFVTNPILLGREIEELSKKKIYPTVTIDPRSPVTTPWDILVNQAAEIQRGGERHGSCGIGFGETIERSENGPTLFASDLVFNKENRTRKISHLREILETVTKSWIPARLEKIGATALSGPMNDFLKSEKAIDRFIKEIEVTNRLWTLKDDSWLSKAAKSGGLILEGAQGLALDQDIGDFPFVTRSFTGMPNIESILHESNIRSLNAIYMTRIYATRHGAGPFPGEASSLDFANPEDPTNIPNQWQGSIRFAPLDITETTKRINKDIERTKFVETRKSIAISCLDQINRDSVSIMEKGKKEKSKKMTLSRKYKIFQE